jgi:hypothetical protein
VVLMRVRPETRSMMANSHNCCEEGEYSSSRMKSSEPWRWSLLDFLYPTKHFSVIRRKGPRFLSRGLEYLHSPSRISNSPRLLRHYHGMAYVPRHIRIASTQQVRPSRPTLCYSSSSMVGCWASNFACRQKELSKTNNIPY